MLTEHEQFTLHFLTYLSIVYQLSIEFDVLAIVRILFFLNSNKMCIAANATAVAITCPGYGSRTLVGSLGGRGRRPPGPEAACRVGGSTRSLLCLALHGHRVKVMVPPRLQAVR